LSLQRCKSLLGLARHSSRLGVEEESSALSGLVSGIMSVVSFLTILPVGNENFSLSYTARYMYLFSIVGCGIGLVAGLLGWSLLHVLPSVLSAIITFGFLLFLTGLHNFDGLMDFGDGLMCKGSPERKIQAMRDTSTGVGAVTLGAFVILITSMSINYFGFTQIIFALALLK
jgi:adenosylcobinamide-GDP ribazoletransferase